METLGITTLTHIAYSTESKCSASNDPDAKGCSDMNTLTLGRSVNQHQHQQ
jgi:hypothetical protein